MESFFSLSIPDQAGLVASILQILGTFWGCVCLFSTLIIGIFSGTFWAKRNLDAAYKAEKDALRKQVENLEKIVKDLEASNNDLLKQVPSGWLEIAEKERRDGNEERAIRHLKNGFTDAAPSLARCCLEIAENHVSHLTDDTDNLLVAERYLKIAQLLDPQNKRVSTLAEEVHAEKTALTLVEGLSPEKLKSLEENEDFLEPNPGLSPEQTVLVLIDRYNISRDKGQYNLAYQLCRRARLIARRHLPSAHPMTLAAQYCYAQILNDLGRCGEALKEIEDLIERVLPKDHPDTLAPRHLHAQILNGLGRHDEALKEINSVISIREHVLPKDHPYMFASRYTHAQILNNLGRHDEALKEINSVISIREHVLPKDHPYMFASRYTHAQILNDLGRHDEALQEIEGLISIQERVLPKDHPDTLSSRYTRAQILNRLGRRGEALKEINSVISIREHVLPKDHPYMFASRYTHAQILNDLGRHDEALQEIEGLISIQERVLPKDHPNTAAAKALRQKIIGDMGK